MQLPDYPRTLHLADSGGRRSRHGCPLTEVAGRHLVIEEKVDGSHCGLGFDDQAELRIFSRNTLLESPPLRRDFSLLDQQARLAMDALWEVLGDRYVLYGEWARITHTVYYDALPAFFLEDDVFDRQAGRFLSTPRRRLLGAALPPAFSWSVAVLHSGPIGDLSELHALVGPSHYKSPDWRDRCALDTVDPSDDMEGLYIKEEDQDFVLRRFKWVRPGFLRQIAAGEGHWRSQAWQENRLAPDDR